MKSKLIGIGKSFGSKIMTNEDIYAFPEVHQCFDVDLAIKKLQKRHPEEDLRKTAENHPEIIFHYFVQSHTNLDARPWSAEGETPEVLAAESAKIALDRAGLKGRDLDAIIMNSMTADVIGPWATVEGHMIGADNIPAYSLNGACAGFGQAMAMAHSFLTSGQYKTVLVSSADDMPSIMDKHDATTLPLWGSGAASVVLTADNKVGMSTTPYVGGTFLNNHITYHTETDLKPRPLAQILKEHSNALMSAIELANSKPETDEESQLYKKLIIHAIQQAIEHPADALTSAVDIITAILEHDEAKDNEIAAALRDALSAAYTERPYFRLCGDSSIMRVAARGLAGVTLVGEGYRIIGKDAVDSALKQCESDIYAGDKEPSFAEKSSIYERAVEMAGKSKGITLNELKHRIASETKCFAGHHPSLRFDETFAKALKLPIEDERDMFNLGLEWKGNCSGATSGYHLCQLIEKGIVRSGDAIGQPHIGGGYCTAYNRIEL